jgi:hypothetical protein
MRRKLLTLLAAAILLSPSLAIAQIGQTATLSGTVADTSGAVLPGVTVTVSGESLIGGTRTTVTDENGSYRFPSLAPGTYTVKFELSSFKTVTQEARLQLGQTISVDVKLEVGGLAEAVNVVGESPIVDVKSSAAQTNLSTDILEYVPFTNRFGPAAMLMAPGVHPTNYSSYGSGASSSNAYMIDGVDVSDPEGGTIWLFANYNWIQEVQVIGLGANAEYGGFTGVASNSLFRSGSNAFHGLFETLYENDALTGSNTSDAILEENPNLRAGTTDYVTDSTFQIGGPFKRDKLWFFTSFQYYRPKNASSGYPPTPPAPYTTTGIGPQARLEVSPRYLFKPTLKLGTSDQLTGFFEYDSYTVDARRNSARVATEATLHQDSPEASWNINYTKVLSNSAVFDVKYSGFWGYYYLSPYNGDNTPGWYDQELDFYSQNSYYFYNADRVRNQANASLTKFASGFAGEHNLKFGVEFERGYVKSELGYPGGMFVYANDGVPYYGVVWDGYLKDNINTRFTAYAQDAWSIGPRLTINPGLRMDLNRGSNKHLDENVFSTTAWGPRIGFAWDVGGNSKTVVRGHYGWYYDGAKSTYYDLLDPLIAPKFGAELDENAHIVGEPYITAPGTNRTMDDNIKQPRMIQSIIGFEQQIGRSMSASVTGIWRKNDQFIDDVLTNGTFSTRTIADPGPDGVYGTGDETSATVTGYGRLSDPLDYQFLITNPDGAERNYKGVEFVFNKRLTGRWLMQASWVISKIDGNYNNTNNFGNSTEFDNPNLDYRTQPFRVGRLTNDITNIGKVLGSYRAPWDVWLSGAYYFTSGQTFTRTYRPPSSVVAGRPTLFIEPRGSERYDDRPELDFKIEKQFRLRGEQRLGVTFEGFNVFNNDAITARTTASGSTFFTPQGLVGPQRYRIGAVFRF